jgi:hypothetical protein
MTSFYQDRLRTNIGKALKNDDRFPSLGHCSWNADRTEGAVLEWSEKRHFLRHLYIKTIFLPRQARDKHRENSKRVMRFSQEYVPRHALLRYLGAEVQEDKTRPETCLVLYCLVFLFFSFAISLDDHEKPWSCLPRQARDTHSMRRKVEENNAALLVMHYCIGG